MTTFRFGTSTSPCKTAAEPQLQQEADIDEQADWDPESLQQCPFDKNHQIRACRFPYHIIKCRKNHPKLASELKTCPFNARHLVPKDELAYHIETCNFRKSVYSGDAENTNGHCNKPLPVSTWVNPNMTEDWDNEADDTAAPFIWGVTTNFCQRLDVQPTNMLGPHCRAPAILPWSSEEQ